MFKGLQVLLKTHCGINSRNRFYNLIEECVFVAAIQRSKRHSFSKTSIPFLFIFLLKKYKLNYLKLMLVLYLELIVETS